MRIRFYLAASAAAITVAGFSQASFAQSTGSVDFEEEIVVSGTITRDVGGIQAPDTPKAKAVLTQEFIARQNPGQTILDTINQIPAVNFQNNDAYGSAGGTLNIRGFGGDRISLTFDGIPLNDSGNYAIYSNQQLDPELIEQVSVNLGTTDVDSPTASAVGGTVNYRTLNPTEEFGVKLSGSAGEFEFFRIFGLINTGTFTPFGTRAWFSASTASNNNPFNNYGVVDKQQYNAKIYQPLGDNGDFISVAGNYNENRNNFFGSLPLRQDVGRTVGSGSGNRFPTNNDEREYLINYPCQTDTPQTGVVDSTNTCGTEFDRRYNPSNTGNIRINSKFTLAEGVVLTVDPSFQYVKANGGGTITGREGVRTIGGVNYTGFIGGQYYFGRDLNGDGDILDTCSTTGGSCSSSNTNGVTLLSPSQTQTRRYGVIANLRYDFNDQNTVRLSYTFDRARHRQTGEVGLVDRDGEPLDVFSVNSPVLDANGFAVQKRDRLSYAILNQVAAEYRGEFFDEALTVNAGVRAPFFKRDLNNNCYTTSAGGFIDCFGGNATQTASYGTANPTFSAPQQRVYKYDKILPNVGVVYKFTPDISLFGSYAQGLSVPGTDSLYNAFFFPLTTEGARPDPETTDSFDLGLRFRNNKVQAQLTGWYTQYQNRLASAYDPELDQNVFRNLGNVKKWGIDGSVSFQPVKEILLYAFGSWNKSKIKDNVAFGENTDGTPIFAATAGKRESGAPTYSFGGTVRGTLGPVDIGLTAKRTGPRYIFDTNEATYTGTFVPTGAVPSGVAVPTARTEIFGAKAPAYTMVNLDARLNLEWAGLNDKTYVQLNVYNLFDKFYVGGFGGGLNQSLASSNGYNRATGVATYGSPGFVQIGAPRTISATVVMGF